MNSKNYYTILINVLKQTAFTTNNRELKEAVNCRIAQYENYINGLQEVTTYKDLSEWKRLNKSSRPQIERVAKHHVDETIRYINRPLFDNKQDSKNFEAGLYNAVLMSYLLNKPIEFGIVTVLPQKYIGNNDSVRTPNHTDKKKASHGK